jgi:molybdopterin/thiamine biosynthesis adenylyltransferase
MSPSGKRILNFEFDYEQAFSRNIGWVTQAEQERLRRSRIAIGGLGGVGGAHLLTLARMGIGKFSIADFDVFDIVNFNRQVGATMNALNRPKVDVMAELVREVNPEIELLTIPEGVSVSTVNAFLKDVDVYVDGLDFFAFDARRLTFAACEERSIPVVTAAPLGLGTSVLVFAPGSMPFEEYFGFDGCDATEMAIRFLVGLSPAMLQRGYVVDMSRINLREQRGPSNVAACQLCAGVAAVETLKLLLDRRGVRLAPWGSQFDAYRQHYVRTWRPWGHRNPLQRLMCALVRSKVGSAAN